MSLMLNPGCCAAVMRMRSCLAMRAASATTAPLRIRGSPRRHVDRRESNRRGMLPWHVKRHWPPEIHHVDERMGRVHHPGQHLKVCLRVGEVAYTAIGDHTQAAEPKVNIGVHFAPEGTIARSIIKVFDENDRRLLAALLDVPVIVDHVGRLTRLVLRPNTRGAGITYDRG